MKRYGFKFPERDGTYTTAIDLRYLSVGGGILIGGFAAAFNSAQGGVILGSIPIFWILGMLSEGWPKYFFPVTLAVAVSCIVAVVLFVGKANSGIDLILGTCLSLAYFALYIGICVQGFKRCRQANKALKADAKKRAV